MIRIIYTDEPKFPASDQHPQAVRYKIGLYWVDAIGGEPTMQEVLDLMNPVPIDRANPDNHAKEIGVLIDVIADLTGTPIAQVRAKFDQVWKAKS